MVQVSSILRLSPILLAGASWLSLVAYVLVAYVPGLDPGSPSLARTAFMAAGAGAFLLSPAAVVVGVVFLVRRINRAIAITGIVLGLPLTSLFVYFVYLVSRGVV